MRNHNVVTLHRDGSMTYWSVYLQLWMVGVFRISDRELNAMEPRNRARVFAHLAGVKVTL